MAKLHLLGPDNQIEVQPDFFGHMVPLTPVWVHMMLFP